MPKITLNPAQKKAIEHKAGPLLIIAGAGTGKTRVITQRLAHLVEKKLAKPEEILALTFTQKAAQEMEERVDIAMPYGYNQVWISTFHAFCDRVLRQEAIYIGLDPGYVLMSRAQEYMYFRSKLFELPLTSLRPQGNPTKFIQEILKHFSRMGDENVSSEEYADFVGKTDGFSKAEKSTYEELAEVYREFNKMKIEDARLSFYDLVPLTLRLFNERPEVLERYQGQFKFVLVDEFQDTNYAQNELLKLLAGDDCNITVVGDDDQAIYKFRGAAISNILDFKKSFPKYAKIVLTENYRSPQEILDKSYKLIVNNNPYRLEVTEKIDKKLKSHQSSPSVHKKKAEVPDSQLGLQDIHGVPSGSQAVRRIHAANDVEEADQVAKEIKSLVEKNKLEYRDVAILVRANNHADEFVQALRHNGIPYTFPGPKGLYTRPEIKDLIAFLRILVDYTDDNSMYRILRLPFSDLEVREYIDLQRLAKKKRLSVFELIERLADFEVGFKSEKTGDEVAEEVPDFGLSKASAKILSKKSLSWVKNLLKVFDEAFKMMRGGKSVGEVLYEIVNSVGYVAYLISNESTQNEWKVQNISKFFNQLKKFEKESDDPGVFPFMEYLDFALEIGESPETEPIDLSDFNAVNILTVHGAKGLEFPVVFMVNLVSDRFPSRNRAEVLPIPDGLIKEILPEGDEHLQEERRLFYVGMTRAEKLLYLTSADYYAGGVRKKKQSIFLHELDLVEDLGDQSKAKRDLKDELSKLKFGTEIEEIPPDIRESFLAGIKRNLSYSHISSYLNCPYQFYFKYILGVPGLESQAKSFGLTVHNTLREFYERLRKFKQGFEGIRDEPSKKDLLEIYEQKWQSAGYETKKQEEQRFKSGKKSLEEYYDKFYNGEENPIWLEENFRVNLGDFWLRGVVDRLDRTDKGLEVIDYKTGKVPSDIHRLKKDLQPALYLLAVEKILGEQVEKASLLYIEGPEKLEIKIDDKLKKDAVDQVTNVLATIKKLEFDPNPGILCKFCDYRGLCDYASQG